jgi:hypothetical protein
MVAPAIAAAGITAAGSLIGGKMAADAQEDAAGRAAAASAPIPFSSPLYNTRFIGTGADRYLATALTPQAQEITSGLLSDYRSIPLSDLTETGELYDRGSQVFGMAEDVYGRAGTALDRAATPEASLNFLERAYGPQLERQRLQQETRLANQGLLGATAGALQTEALSQGQQQALLQGALQQQQFQGQLGSNLLGQTGGLLGSSINFARQDLAERQFLNNIRSGSLSGALGLLGGAQDAAALTMKTGSPSGTAQAAGLSAAADQQMAGNIAAGLQSLGLGFLNTQQPGTGAASAGNLASGSFLSGGGTGFSGTGSLLPATSGQFSGTTPLFINK